MPKKDSTYIVAAHVREMNYVEKCERLAQWFSIHKRHTETNGAQAEDVQKLAGGSHTYEDPPIIYLLP